MMISSTSCFVRKMYGNNVDFWGRVTATYSIGSSFIAL